uniref:DDE-1 domain-containing protein n=1 Tax=Panagrellus redivivus TaxID=6233 RepID=A0A7E4UTU3_PANRE
MNRKRKANRDTTQTREDAATASVDEEVRRRLRVDRRNRANPTPPQHQPLDSFGVPLSVEPRGRSPTLPLLPSRRRTRQRRRHNSHDSDVADDDDDDADDAADAATPPQDAAPNNNQPLNLFEGFTQEGAHGRRYIHVMDRAEEAAKKKRMAAAFGALRPLFKSYSPAIQEVLFESGRTWLGWSDNSVPIKDAHQAKYFTDEWRAKKALYAVTRIVAEDPKLCHPAGKRGRESGISWICYPDSTYEEKPQSKQVFRNEVLFSMAISGNQFTARGYRLLTVRRLPNKHPKNLKPVMSMSSSSMPVAYPITSVADPLQLSNYLGLHQPWATAYPGMTPTQLKSIKALMHRLLTPAMFGRFGNRSIFPHLARFFVGLTLSMKLDDASFLY